MSLSLLSSWSTSSLPLLDIRPRTCFQSIRLSSLRVSNVPGTHVMCNCFQLPPRNKSFGVLGTGVYVYEDKEQEKKKKENMGMEKKNQDKNQEMNQSENQNENKITNEIGRVEKINMERKYCCCGGEHELTEEEIRLADPIYWKDWLISKGWLIEEKFVFEANDIFWENAKSLGLLETANDPMHTCFLFEPCHILKEVIQQLEETLSEKSKESGVIKLSACDVGCGNGRDTLWLASRSKANLNFEWNIFAVDYVAPHLQRILDCAKSNDLDSYIRTSRIRIHDDGTLKIISQEADGFNFSKRTYDLVLCVRFLERNFMNTLKKMVKPGGFIVYLAFTAGAEAFDHPKDPKCILKPNELFETFCDGGFQSWVNRVDLLPDGRPVQVLVARKNLK